ncbi:MAG: RAD55 family ATPase [Salinirussus sp.]
MERIPFGISQLDGLVGGGAPPGSVVLLAGEAGAGSREFMYTSAVMHALETADKELFELYYGDLAPEATMPEEVHYISFTEGEPQLQEEITAAMDTELAEPAVDEIEFVPLTDQYFHVSPVPRSWYAREAPDISNLRARSADREDLLSALGERLSRRAPGNLVVIDSVSNLIGAIDEDELTWADISYLITGLARAAYDWNGLILLHVNARAISERRLGQLVDVCTGSMRFSWETGGSTRSRTLVVEQFRSVLSQIEEEDIVQFETELGDAGFDISDVRKIR